MREHARCHSPCGRASIARKPPLIGGRDERFSAPTRVRGTIPGRIRAKMPPRGRMSVTTSGKGPEPGHPRQSLAGIAVVAHTTEDDQHPEVRHAAEVHAQAHGCMLILFAADVASWWSEPMPNQWASEGEGDRFGDRLNPEDLEFLGRSAIAGQVRESRRAGVRASAWLPKDKGIEALAEYASVQGAHIVFVPESLDSIDELRPLLASAGSAGDTARPAIEIHVVGPPDSAMPPPATGEPGSEPS